MAEKVNVPKYSFGEELANSISHYLGAAFALIVTPFLLVKAVNYDGLVWLAVVATCIYCFALFTEYTVSATYHALVPTKAKKVMRVLDHCFIFVLIIGTYAPLTLLAFTPHWLGVALFFINCGAGIIGITFTAIDLKKYAKFSMVCYIAMGWLVVVAAYWLIKSLSVPALILLLAGGVFYTVGAILYGIGHKKKYIHSVWHVFVLLGTVTHFLSIYLYVL